MNWNIYFKYLISCVCVCIVLCMFAPLFASAIICNKKIETITFKFCAFCFLFFCLPLAYPGARCICLLSVWFHLSAQNLLGHVGRPRNLFRNRIDSMTLWIQWFSMIKLIFSNHIWILWMMEKRLENIIKTMQSEVFTCKPLWLRPPSFRRPESTYLFFSPENTTKKNITHNTRQSQRPKQNSTTGRKQMKIALLRNAARTTDIQRSSDVLHLYAL